MEPKIIVLAISCALFLPLIDSRPNCSGSNQFKHVLSDDCRTLWHCVGSIPIKHKECPKGLAVRQDFRCVRQGSELDECSRKNRCGKQENPCKNGGRCVTGTTSNAFDCICNDLYSGPTCETEPSPEEKCVAYGKYTKLADKEQCQMYYDCAKRDEKTGILKKQECDYPLQFDTETNECAPFEKVNCGKRKNLKSKCQYNKYKTLNHGPHNTCEVNNPSCEGRPNGLQPHSRRKNPSWYMVCQRERIVRTGICRPDKYGPKVATKNAGCVNIFCKGKPNGNYPLRNCISTYARCSENKMTTKKCPKISGEELVFDKKRAVCLPKFWAKCKKP